MGRLYRYLDHLDQRRSLPALVDSCALAGADVPAARVGAAVERVAVVVVAR